MTKDSKSSSAPPLATQAQVQPRSCWSRCANESTGSPGISVGMPDARWMRCAAAGPTTAANCGLGQYFERQDLSGEILSAYHVGMVHRAPTLMKWVQVGCSAIRFHTKWYGVSWVTCKDQAGRIFSRPQAFDPPPHNVTNVTNVYA